MKTVNYIFASIAIACSALLFFGFGTSRTSTETERYRTITALDSIFFTADTTCNLKTQAKQMAEDLEFYHDKGGLSTAKSDIMGAMKKNSCGKMTRELVSDSIKLSEITRFGAVQSGMYEFYNSEGPDAVSKPGRFVTLWKQSGDS